MKNLGETFKLYPLFRLSRDSKFMRCQMHHLLPLVLSLAAHVGIMFAFDIGSDVQVGSGSSKPDSMPLMVVELGKAGDTIGMSEHSEQVVDENLVSGQTSLEPLPLLQESTREAIEPIPIAPSEAIQQPSVSSLPDTLYFLSKELTVKPLILDEDAVSLNIRLPGIPAQTAVLRLLISEQGDVDRVEIDESQLPLIASRTVIDAFSKLKFQPGKVGDKAVKSQLRIEIAIDGDPL